MIYDINSINFEDAPVGYNPDDAETTWIGHLHNEDHTGYGLEGEMILVYNDETKKANLSIATAKGWADTSDTKDWPVFDRLFTREQWQKYLETVAYIES